MSRVYYFGALRNSVNGFIRSFQDLFLQGNYLEELLTPARTAGFHWYVQFRWLI